MKRTFCDWNATSGEALGEPYSDEEARRRFEGGERCTVLVGDTVDQATIVMEIDRAGTVVEVTWLDALQRPELMYLFAVRPEAEWPKNKLLLEQTRISMYDSDTRLPDAEAAYSEYYSFTPDGRYYGRRAQRDGINVEETNGQLDQEQLGLQIEPVPAFGDWESLLRQER